MCATLARLTLQAGKWRLDDCRRENSRRENASSRLYPFAATRDPLIEVSIRESKSHATSCQGRKTEVGRDKKGEKEATEIRKAPGWSGEYECREEARKSGEKRRGKGTLEKRRLPRRLIVSENPSSRSFCFRFYFLPSNPPVHCLPFVHTVARAFPPPSPSDTDV